MILYEIVTESKGIVNDFVYSLLSSNMEECNKEEKKKEEFKRKKAALFESIEGKIDKNV